METATTTLSPLYRDCTPKNQAFLLTLLDVALQNRFPFLLLVVLVVGRQFWLCFVQWLRVRSRVEGNRTLSTSTSMSLGSVFRAAHRRSACSQIGLNFLSTLSAWWNSISENWFMEEGTHALLICFALVPELPANLFQLFQGKPCR